MARYRCPGCGYVYDEQRGDVHEGFAPGTRWEQVPDDWACRRLRGARQGRFRTRPCRSAADMNRWRCVVCEFIYDEAAGIPDEDIAPGTRWQDVPDSWTCRDCGAPKSDFRMVKV